MDKSINIGQAIRTGWEVFKRDWKIIWAVLLIGFLAQWVLTAVGGQIDAGLVSFVLGVAAWLVGSWVSFRTVRLSLDWVDGKSVEVRDLWSGFEKDRGLWVQFIVASILFGLMVGLGTIFFLIPGILLGLAYGLYSYLLVDEQMDATDSLKLSKQLTKGVRGKLFLFWLATIGVNLLGALALGVGLFVTGPVTMLASAAVYRQLQGESMSPGLHQDSRPEPVSLEDRGGMALEDPVEQAPEQNMNPEMGM